MKLTCPQLADNLARIHTLSLTLTRGWDNLEPDHRGEVLLSLHSRLGQVFIDTYESGGGATDKSKEAVFAVGDELRNLGDLNARADLTEKDTLTKAKTQLMTRVNELIVEAILACGCERNHW